MFALLSRFNYLAYNVVCNFGDFNSCRGCSIECMEGHRFPGGLKITNILCQEGTWVPRKTEWQTVPDCERKKLTLQIKIIIIILKISVEDQ